MTVLFMDSVAGNDGALRYEAYSPASIQTGVTPSGGNAYRLQFNNGHVVAKAIAAASSVVVGWHWRVSGNNDNDASGALTFRLYGDSGTTVHFSLCNLSATGVLRARLGTSTGAILADSPVGVFPVNEWHFVEVRYVVSDTVGVCQVWVDGVLVIDETGIDTKNGGTADSIDLVRFGRTINNNSDVGDIYIADQSTPLGPCRPIWLPVTSDGTHTDFVPLNAGAHYVEVDEATPDGDTTYNAGATEGDIDTYGLTDLPTPGAGNAWQVHAIQTVTYARKSDAGAKSMRPVLRTGGADFSGSTVALAETYDTYTEVFETNPDTAAAWNETEIDALEAGVEVRDS